MCVFLVIVSFEPLDWVAIIEFRACVYAIAAACAASFGVERLVRCLYDVVALVAEHCAGQTDAVTIVFVCLVTGQTDVEWLFHSLGLTNTIGATGFIS